MDGRTDAALLLDVLAQARCLLTSNVGAPLRSWLEAFVEALELLAKQPERLTPRSRTALARLVERLLALIKLEV
jgi:hypothetical protein